MRPAKSVCRPAVVQYFRVTATEPCEANRPLYGAFSRPAALARKSLIEERAAYRFRFGKRFGDQAYAAEELVAEIGAALLCAELRITQETRPDHAQYLARWLTLLKGDQRALFAASAKASEAAMYLKRCSAEERSAA